MHGSPEIIVNRSAWSHASTNFQFWYSADKHYSYCVDVVLGPGMAHAGDDAFAPIFRMEPTRKIDAPFKRAAQ